MKGEDGGFTESPVVAVVKQDDKFGFYIYDADLGDLEEIHVVGDRNELAKSVDFLL